MTAPTDQFVDIAKRSQEAVTTAVRTWADSVQSFAGSLTAGQARAARPAESSWTATSTSPRRCWTPSAVRAEWVCRPVHRPRETVSEQATKAAETVTAQTVNGTEQAAAEATEPPARRPPPPRAPRATPPRA